MFYVGVRFFLVLFLINFSLEAQSLMVRTALSGLANCARRAVVQKRQFHDGELADVFKRVITQKKELCEPIDDLERHLLMSARWIHSEWLKPTPPSSETEAVSTPHARFHSILANRIKTGIISGTIKWDPFSEIKKPGIFEDKAIDKLEVQANGEVGRKMGKAFMAGQCLSEEGFTQFDIVLATMSESPRRHPHRFFLPIEQAILCQTLGEYRSHLALLKNWGIYSRFGIAVIPAGTYVSIRMGPVAQQMFPNANTDIFSRLKSQASIEEIEDIANAKEALSKTTGCENDYWRFYENLPGGATQILFAYAYKDPHFRSPQKISAAMAGVSERIQNEIYNGIGKIAVYGIENVFYDPREKIPTPYKLEFKNNRNGNPWNPDKIGLKDSHFFMTKKDNVPVAYDDIKIDFSMAFRAVDILSPTEHKKLRSILKPKEEDHEGRK